MTYNDPSPEAADRGATRFYRILGFATLAIALIFIVIGVPEIWHIEADAYNTPGIDKLNRLNAAVPVALAATAWLLAIPIGRRSTGKAPHGGIMVATALITWMVSCVLWFLPSIILMAIHLHR